MNYDLTIQQGADYNLSLTITDVSGNPQNLTNCLLSGFIKTHFYDTGILANLNVTVVNPASGTISFYIPATGTTGIPINISFYDVSLYNTNTSATSKILYGKVFSYPEVTF